MSDQNYRKPLLLALAGAVAITAVVYTYNQYANHARTKTEPEANPATSLHRSNAIRRPRANRPAPDGYQPVLDYEPIQRALRNLHRRNQTSHGYGEYDNTYFFPTPEVRQGLDLALLPRNLTSIYHHALQQSPSQLSVHQRACLHNHICCLFLQNFLREEFPLGFVFGRDAGTLASALTYFEVDSTIVNQMTKAFDEGHLPIASVNLNLEGISENNGTAQPGQTDGAVDAGEIGAREILQALAGRDHNDDDSDSDMSFGNRDEDPAGSQNMLDLLYHIASEQARREGYIHRGVECNGCGVHPIAGIRYHCANCFDFDLCESCEANTSHVKSHVFYKIRIPAPSRGNVKQVVPKWYPGVPDAFPNSLPSSVSKPLLEETSIERTEIDALYEQFKCVAGHFYPADPTGLGVAIDRKGFDTYFMSSNGDRASPANLIYDRIFAFYDTDRNGFITFDEYIRGLDRLQDKSRFARLKRIFEGYDLDGDGYVDRKDFLRMFRAYYALSKELSREMISTQGDFGYNEEELQEVVQGSQPISAAFGGANLYGHESRTGQDKQRQPNGDLQPTNGLSDVLQHDTEARGDRARAIGNAAFGDPSRNHPFRTFRREEPEDEPVMMVPSYGDYAGSGLEEDDVAPEELTGPDAPLQTYSWPPLVEPIPEDITDALGQLVPLEDITDPVDRTRVLYAQSQRLDAIADQVEETARGLAVNERWRQRQFYLDEEEGFTRPPGYQEPDSSDEEETPQAAKKRVSPRRASMASRSSSKVRFDDSAIDTDYETRSNTSSRSIPVNERWGGYELSQAEADIGKDILYQAVQQGFNQLLDALFKEKEGEYMGAQQTRNDRTEFEQERKRFGEILEANSDLVDPKQSTDIGYMQRRNDKEEARHAATGKTQHLKGPNTVISQLESSYHEDQRGLTFFSDVQPGDSPSELPAIPKYEPAEPYRDPTLPQFRPDEAQLSSLPGGPNEIQSEVPETPNAESQDLTRVNEEHPPTPANSPSKDESDGPGPATAQRARPENGSPIIPKRPNPFAGHPMEARETYYLWLRHDLIDAEANRRGGGGKLNISEFRRKMAPEDEVAKALGDKNKGKNEDGDADTWESSADMGKLAFVGTWLEMASF